MAGARIDNARLRRNALEADCGVESEWFGLDRMGFIVACIALVMVLYLSITPDPPG
jgi:hypothetical protein